MNSPFEVILYDDSLPARVFVYSLDAYPQHWHSDVEIVLVLDGSIFVTVQGVTRPLSEGELIVINANTIHSTEQSGQSNYILVLQFDAQRLMPFHPAAGQLRFSLEGGAEAHAAIAPLRRLLCRYAMERGSETGGSQNRKMAYLQEILALLIEHCQTNNASGAPLLKPRDQERLRRITEYIGEHYAQRFTLGDVARMEGVSANHLSNFFSRAAQMSLSEYISRVRLRAYIEHLQTDASTPLEEIAEKCGFSSPQYAAALFRSAYNETPGQYRRGFALKNALRESAQSDATYQTMYRPFDMKPLLRYAEDAPAGAAPANRLPGVELCLSLQKPLAPYGGSAVRVTSIGRAFEGLMAAVQAQLIRAKAEIGFTHVRFHGIFNDEMMILRSDERGELHYSWKFTDLLLDSLLNIGYKPFLELTFMPSLLASGNKYAFTYKGNITPPRDLPLWRELVRRFTRHIIRRYGEDEVSAWYFELWNEPELPISWTGTQPQYMDFMCETAEAILENIPRARLVGPSINGGSLTGTRFMQTFTERARVRGIPFSHLSIHCYPEDIHTDRFLSVYRSMNQKKESLDPKLPLQPQDYASRQLSALRRAAPSLRLPVVVTEWNITALPFNPVNDSAYAATALIDSALSCDAPDVTLIHWTLTDLMQEQILPAAEFYGGFGALSFSGLPKPTYWALWALSRLSGHIMARDDGVIITKDSARVCVLAWRHPQMDTAYDPKLLSGLAAADAPGETREIALTVTNLTKGVWRGAHARFDPAMHAPVPAMHGHMPRGALSRADKEELTQRLAPERRACRHVCDADGLKLTLSLRECGFELIELTKDD